MPLLRPKRGNMPSSLPNDDRIVEVLDLVAAGKYVDGQTPRELAARWGIGREQTSDLITQAFRFRRLSERKNLQEKLTMLLARLDADRKTALSLEKVVTYKGEITARIPQPDVGAAIAATRLYLDALGVLVRKPAGAGAGDTKPIDTMSVDELRAMASSGRQALDEIDALIREKETAHVH
jgi:hypothetical protein